MAFMTGFGETRQLRTKIINYKNILNGIIQSVISPEGLKLQAAICNITIAIQGL